MYTLNSDVFCLLLFCLMTKNVTFLHLGQQQFCSSGLFDTLGVIDEYKKDRICGLFYYFILFFYQNFHQGLLEAPACFALLVEVVPVAWPVTLSFRLPFSSWLSRCHKHQ